MDPASTGKAAPARRRGHSASVHGAIVLAATLVVVGSAAGSTSPRVIGKITAKPWETSELFVMHADGSRQTNITNSLVNESEPAWSPNGSKLAFGRRSGCCESAIFVMNADGGGLTKLTHPRADGVTSHNEPAWSPDGRKIAFVRAGVIESEIFVMNADGSQLTNLTNNPDGNDSAPAWSPDGKKVAFDRDPDDSAFSSNREIFVMNADGSKKTNLTRSPQAADAHPAWSPDGTRIAFVRYRRPGNDEIFVMNADGSHLANLSKFPVADFDPAWSPDGRRIVFTSFRGSSLQLQQNVRGHTPNPEIIVMNADGSRQKNLTKSPADDINPAWSPDGRRIAFERYEGTCLVPKVVGEGLPLARAMIKQNNCSLGRIRRARSARARGGVLRQSPRAGAQLRGGTRINLVVSRGRA